MKYIENEMQYNWAVTRVEELLKLTDENTASDNPLMIELKLLSHLVADYSETHFSIGKPSLVEVMKLRLYEMNLTKQKLAEILGVSQSKISDYLSGKSEPTLPVARIISRRLNIDPAIVLGV